MKNEDTFCVFPWMHLATTPGGTFRICCNSDNSNNKILKNDGSVFKIYKDDVDDVVKSNTYVEIKQQMLSGIKPKTCSRCFKQEEAGVESSRQVYNTMWKHKVDVSSETQKVLYLDLRLGNQCNLKCRMCNPYSSNQWVDEWEMIYGKFSDKERSWISQGNWQKTTNINKNLFKIAHTVEEIYLTGGEPTLIKEQDLLLDYCIENDLAKNIQLKYSTNLTHIPDSLINKWKKFKKVLLNCSIDAYGDLNTYIRYPITWKKIERNFEKIKKIENLKIDISITVQNYNILHLGKLLDWIENNKQPDSMIFFNILEDPKNLNIRCLPVDLKNLAISRLTPYTHIPRLTNMLDYMMMEETSYWNSFIEFTKKVDSIRNENILTVVPEFNKYF